MRNDKDKILNPEEEFEKCQELANKIWRQLDPLGVFEQRAVIDILSSHAAFVEKLNAPTEEDVAQEYFNKQKTIRRRIF